MKLSNYSTKVIIDEKKDMVYNTISRQYYLYPVEKKDEFWNFLNNLNRKTYSVEEANLICKLAKKGIIVEDNKDELSGLAYLENKSCYQNSVFKMTIFTTNACNFRCTYCMQSHETRILDDAVSDKIIDAIDAVSRKVKKLDIMWFGGEPLLQYRKMKKILSYALPICEKNHCELVSHAVTNGYLLDEDMVCEMKELHVRGLQITVDGNRNIHNSRRILADGTGTYDIVCSNIITVLKHGISVTLRINIDKESVHTVPEILNDIPECYRNMVSISICNLFQEENKQSTYSFYYQAIKMGYQYSARYNEYAGCQSCGFNSLVVDTDGKIRFCTNAEQEDGIIGELKSHGIVSYKHRSSYEKDLMQSVRDRKQCQSCIELPFCIGSCKKSVKIENKTCFKQHSDGLCLSERAKLDYYADLFSQNTGTISERAEI